ncbi:hypothetical protein DM01DRAFT_1383256 [Hesseltinella vesiculosa]|uniref:BRCT domain-containing protein n=1 Tax=Hesseltinella vesiculosa TaxID=101127 RepID=A0A1X2GID9_9FUNG|nr:hypothetical protein DM01DRAFT_1383256 [Hesseltinella vesiculosa]
MASSTLFDDVVFELDPMLSDTKRKMLENLLIDHGGLDILSKLDIDPTARPTHFITNNVFTKTNADHRVIPKWVEAAVANGMLHDPKYYDPDPTKFLTGVVVACSGLPLRDNEAIFGACLALGGQFRTGPRLADDVTHLVVISPEGEKYGEAMQRGDRVKVILPHWFDECFKLRRYVREDIYMFPDPLILTEDGTNPRDQAFEAMKTDLTPSNNRTEPKDLPVPTSAAVPTSTKTKLLAADSSNTSSHSVDIPVDIDQATDHELEYRDIFAHNINYDTLELEALKVTDRFLDNKRIYFDSSLGIPREFQAVLREKLEQAGATTTTAYSTDLVDIAIFKKRGSKIYQQASRDGKLVASPSYIINTLYRKRLTSPLLTFWDYPLPNGRIPGMEYKSATISGYEDEARAMLYKLCTIVGLQCSTSLENNTTLVICSTRNSKKYHVARLRNCDIVNHLWLEESFQNWECKSMTDDRYTYFPKDGILQSLVGRTPLLADEVSRWHNDNTTPKSSRIPSHLTRARSPSVYPEGSSTESAITSPSSSHGTLVSRGPRKAAMEAQTNLEQIIVPDMNRFDQEQKARRQSAKRGLSDLDKAGHPGPSDAETTDDEAHADPSHRQTSAPANNDTSKPLPKKPRLAKAPAKPRVASFTATPPAIRRGRSSQPVAPGSEVATARGHRRAKTLPLPELGPDGHPDGEMDEIESSTSSQATNQQDSGVDPSAPSWWNELPSNIVTSSAELDPTVKSTLQKLGIRFSDSVLKASHVLVDDRFVRTPKVLVALNLGRMIITKKWAVDSAKAKKLLSPARYRLHDKVAEVKYKFDLRDTLLNRHDKDQGWLHGFSVCVMDPTIATSLKDVVTTSGARFVAKAPTSKRNGPTDPDRFLALADPESESLDDYRAQLVKANITALYNIELLFIGCLRQKLEREDYLL